MIKMRVSNRSQNNMGEITEQTRLYVLPFTEQGVKIVTRFEYDSWGRTLNMTYPDGEKLTYEYDRGGQLKSMQGVKDSLQYNYLENITYDKFGAKTLVKYGNNLTTTYSYNPQNLRLISQNIAKTSTSGQTDYLNVTYSYDPKGNITGINTSNSQISNFSSDEKFYYDMADQLDSASGNNGSLYTVKMSYGNYGRVNTYNTTFTDPQTSTSTQLNTNYVYGVNASNRFAPVSADNGNITFEYGINGSMRKRTTPDKTEYYLFNAFDQMKAYSDNGEKYGYYNYDEAGQRMYKITLNNTLSRVNAMGDNVLEVEKLMLYPNGYININQDGAYTKHYYADALRIASKIGSGKSGLDLCNEATAIENAYPGYLTDRINIQYEEMKEELWKLVPGSEYIVDITPIPYPDFCNLQGNGGQETGLFFYHPDHLGSTGMVTDNNATVTQGFLYTPFGELLYEYSPGWQSGVIPKYSFNAKELDEENGMYYYSARYYAPPTFISRDPLFEKYPFISPYAYCANNPVILVDPDGRDWVEREVEGRKEVYYDRSVKSQSDVNKKYGKNSGIKHLTDGSKVGNGQYTVYNDHKNNRDGVIKDKNGNVVNNDRTILQNEGHTIFAGVTDKSINAETLHNNFFGTSYIGPNNPKDYNGDDNYDYIPRNPSEMPAFRHDQAYDAIGTAGIKGALLDLRTLKADYRLIKECWDISKNPAMSAKDKSIARKTAIGFGIIMGIKIKLTTPF